MRHGSAKFISLWIITLLKPRRAPRSGGRNQWERVAGGGDQLSFREEGLVPLDGHYYYHEGRGAKEQGWRAPLRRRASVVRLDEAKVQDNGLPRCDVSRIGGGGEAGDAAVHDS